MPDKLRAENKESAFLQEQFSQAVLSIDRMQNLRFGSVVLEKTKQKKILTFRRAIYLGVKKLCIVT